jgi:polyisoprenoid-binding protein YceI
MALLLALGGCAAPGTDPTTEAMPAGMSFSADSTRFTIDPQQSEARFAIDELLLGEPKTVTAVSSGVTGEIGVDFETPANTAVGPIQVDTRQFLTDNDFRNRAIRSRILLSDAYPTVTFTPTAVNGLPESIPWGEAVQFQITGDLTITGHTEPVTFDVTVLPVSESRLEGQAAATILRQDFDLVVPSATGVAGVGEEVTLELSFVAAPQE